MIHAEERATPKNRKKIDWKLITDLPVQSRKDAIEKLESQGSQIRLHGRGSKAWTAQRLANLIAVYCIVSWRIFWMTMLHRSTPEAAYFIKIARLGGYLARANAPPPGRCLTWAAGCPISSPRPSIPLWRPERSSVLQSLSLQSAW